MSKGGQPPLACQIWVQIPGPPTAQWGATGSYRHRWEQPMGEKEKGDFNVAWKSEALAALQYSSKSIMAATANAKLQEDLGTDSQNVPADSCCG